MRQGRLLFWGEGELPVFLAHKSCIIMCAESKLCHVYKDTCQTSSSDLYTVINK